MREPLVERLRAAGCVAAEEEADEMLAGATDPTTLDRWVARRTDGEPLAWIVGATTFCGIRLRVDPGVYVPRPQTEDLARRAVALLPTGGRPSTSARAPVRSLPTSLPPTRRPP